MIYLFSLKPGRSIKLICEKFQKHGIILSPKKIELEIESIEFLGVIVDQNGLKLQQHILVKIRDFSNILRNKTQLQSLL